MTDETKTISSYIRNHPIRELCKCGRGPVNPEYEVCESCYLDAQSDVINLDDARKLRALERLMAGEEE